MSHPRPLSESTQHGSQDPWKKPLRNTILLGILFSILYLFITLFIYKNTLAVDDIINTTWTTCAGGTLTYTGGGTLTFFMKGLTFLGSKSFLTLMTLLVCFLFYRNKHTSLAVFFALQMITGGALNFLLKQTFNRPRPNMSCLHEWVSNGSFPSGHTMMFTLFLGTLIFLLTRKPMLKKYRSMLMVSALILSFAVGISRLYLGVHWCSDVIGGWLFGLFWTIVGLNFFTSWEQSTHGHPPNH
jgi:undecaprenyl-diphosphatase